jgi:hypothetical protein
MGLLAKTTSTAKLLQTAIAAVDEARERKRRSHTAAKAAAIGIGGLAGLVAASAGISSLRRRVGKATDGS